MAFFDFSTTVKQVCIGALIVRNCTSHRRSASASRPGCSCAKPAAPKVVHTPREGLVKIDLAESPRRRMNDPPEGGQGRSSQARCSSPTAGPPTKARPASLTIRTSSARWPPTSCSPWTIGCSHCRLRAGFRHRRRYRNSAYRCAGNVSANRVCHSPHRQLS